MPRWLKNRRRKKSKGGNHFTSLTINDQPVSSFQLHNGRHYEPYFIDSDLGFRLKTHVYVHLKWKENGVHREKKFTIAKGYPWDGASIPSFLTGLIGSKTNRAFVLASLLHDYSCEFKVLGHYPESRMFYEVLKTRSKDLDLSWWKEKAMYAAVYMWSVVS